MSASLPVAVRKDPQSLHVTRGPAVAAAAAAGHTKVRYWMWDATVGDRVEGRTYPGWWCRRQPRAEGRTSPCVAWQRVGADLAQVSPAQGQSTAPPSGQREPHSVSRRLAVAEAEIELTSLYSTSPLKVTVQTLGATAAQDSCTGLARMCF